MIVLGIIAWILCAGLASGVMGIHEIADRPGWHYEEAETS